MNRVVVILALASLAIVLLVYFGLKPAGRVSNPSLIPYANTPGAIESKTYKLTVNSQPVFVEKFKDVSYARFALSGKADLRVSAAGDFQACTLSPLSYAIQTERNGNDISFSISQSRKLILQCDGLEKLFIFADDPEQKIPKPGDPGVVSIKEYVKDNTGETVVTAQIQKAIDEITAKPGGGTLFFPNGKYSTGTIVLKSNVTLYLESGALLQGVLSPQAYYIAGSENAKDIGARGRGALIYVVNANNARIEGRGTIAMQGSEQKKLTANKIRICNIVASSNVEIRDVVIRDSGGFNIHMLKSNNLLLKGYKIINDITLPNQDGTDPDSSQNVLIEDVFMYTSDDAIAVKADYGLVKDIVVRNSVFWTKKSALKVGSDPYYGAENIVFENNDVVQADRMLALYAVKGYIDGVKYVNNKSEAIKLKDLGKLDKQQLIVFEVSDQNCCSEPSEQMKETKIKDKKTTYINNVLIDGYYAYKQSPKGSTIKGLNNDHQVTNVTFKDFYIEGKLILDAKDAKMIIGPNTENVTFTSTKS